MATLLEKHGAGMAESNKSYSVRIKNNILHGQNDPKTVILYSPDKDFSVSLSLALQDFFNVITTDDLEMLPAYVISHNADVVIVDATMTENIRECFERLKHGRRFLRIIVLYVARVSEKKMSDTFRNTVDAVFYKPFEIGELLDGINRLL